MITLCHVGGMSSISPVTISTSGCSVRAVVTASEKPTRSTASAPPAGSLCASPALRMSEPVRRISSCSTPTALNANHRTEKSLSTQVPQSWLSRGRLSSLPGAFHAARQGNRASAICQAASEPARPAPTTWMGSRAVMGATIKPVMAKWNLFCETCGICTCADYRTRRIW